MDLGLGFVSAAVIDQHFSERGRLGRLLSVLAQHPTLLGVGIDEDTALVIERGQSLEVVGSGAVTIVDPRQSVTDADAIGDGQRIEMLGLRLHLLPAGHLYASDSRALAAKRLPPGLREAINLLVEPGPIRG